MDILAFPPSLPPSHRSMYWVDAGVPGRPPRIEKSAMDGSGRSTVVANISGQPRSVAVHHPPGAVDGRIYWTDEMNGLIESASLEGSDRRVDVGKGIS